MCRRRNESAGSFVKNSPSVQRIDGLFASFVVIVANTGKVGRKQGQQGAALIGDVHLDHDGPGGSTRRWR